MAAVTICSDFGIQENKICHVSIASLSIWHEVMGLWLPDVKNWLLGKDPDAGKDWRWEEKGMTENEMVGWHHQLNEHEFEQAPGVSDGQGNLVCYSPWGPEESDMTQQLNNTCIIQGGQWLTVLIGNSRLYNKMLYGTYLSHNSICYNNMYVFMGYL